MSGPARLDAEGAPERMATVAETSAATRTRQLLESWLAALAQSESSRSHAGRPWRLLVLCRPDGIEVYRQKAGRGGTPERLGRLGAGASEAEIAALKRAVEAEKPESGTTVLRLGAAQVIATTVTPPIAAEPMLAQVVANQVELLAPWPADKALFAHEVTGRRPADGQLDVALTITGRKLVEDLIADARRIGLNPAIVDAGDEPAPPARINLLPQAKAGAPAGIRRIRRLLTLALTVALGIGTLGAVRTGLAVQADLALDADIASMRAKAREAGKLRSENEALERHNLMLARLKTEHPSVTITLEHLSRAIPDDTWLAELEVRSKKLRLAGKSRNAPALIARLEAVPGLSLVRFGAPTTREAGADIDTFVIEADLAPVLDIAEKEKGK